MINHERGKLLTIDENDFRGNDVCELFRVTRKVGRCNENTFVRTLPLKGTCKFLDFRPADSSLPSFGLDIDDVQAKLVFFNDSVDATISTLADGSSCVSTVQFVG